MIESIKPSRAVDIHLMWHHPEILLGVTRSPEPVGST